MPRIRCGCSTHDEGTNFCQKHRLAYATMLAKDNGLTDEQALFYLDHEGLAFDQKGWDEL